MTLIVVVVSNFESIPRFRLLTKQGPVHLRSSTAARQPISQSVGSSISNAAIQRNTCLRQFDARCQKESS